MINFQDWYTDRADIWRVQNVQNGALTQKERVKVQENVPCRLYHTSAATIKMAQTAASIKQDDWLQCANEVDIRPGDELIVRRGAELGRDTAPLRVFAGEPNHFYEPFGAVLPGLAHQEIKLLQEERVK